MTAAHAVPRRSPTRGPNIASIDELLDNGESTLVVDHGGPIRSVCQRLLEPRHVVRVHPGSLSVVDLERRPRLAADNLRLDTRSDEAPD